MSIEGPIITNRNGLIFHVDAANNKSYPGSGNDWIDLTRTNGTGSLRDSVTFSSERLGSMVMGYLRNIKCGNFADNLGEMTISVWMKSGYTSPLGYTQIVSKFNGNLATDPGWSFSFFQQKYSFFTQGAGGTTYRQRYLNTAYVIAPEAWGNHVVVLTGGLNGDILFYMNNVLQTNYTDANVGTVTSMTTNAPVVIGGRETNGGQFASLGGNIGIVSIYNRALSGAEISLNYTAHRTRFGL